jgi:hypothetical protein
MNRLNQILVVLLVLQLVVAAIILVPRPAPAGEGESLYPDVEADRIVGLTITDAQGETLQLAKHEGTWVLPGADDYPVPADKVPPVLAKLAALQAERLVTETPGSHNRLRVADDEFERLVEFELEDGSRYRLYVGTSPSYSVTHVRAEGQDEVYLTSELALQDVGAAASTWVDRTYLDLPSDQIVALTVENQNGTLDLRNIGEAGWMLTDQAEDETLDQGTVTSLANRTATITLLEPLGQEEKPEYGMDNPSAVVTIRTHNEEDGEDQVYTLWVGAQNPEDNSYVIRSSESPYYIRVSEFSVQDLVEYTRDDLLELPPTPTPSTSGAQGTPESP